MNQNIFCRLLAVCCAVAVVDRALAEPLAFVPITSGARLHVLDTRNGNTVALIPTVSAPVGIAIDATHSKLYLAHQNYPTASITAVDMVTRQISAELALPADAWGITLSADGSRAYVTLSGIDRLGIVDTASLSLLATVETGATPRNIVVSADGARIFVSNQSGSSLSVVDAASNTLSGTHPLCSAPLGMVLRPGGDTLYATCFFDNTLVRLDTHSLAVTGSIDTGTGPSAVAISADAARLYVSNTRDDSVTVIDGSTHTPIARIPVGESPYGISVSGDGSRVYVSNVHSRTLTVIDTASNSVTATYPLFESAFAVGQFLAPATVPDAPLIDSASGARGSVTLGFTAPAFDGGSSISSYTATCGTTSQTGTAPTITLNGLVSGATYQCHVHATNPQGDSLPSASLSVIAASTPGAPVPLSIAAGTGQATLAFNAPGDDGGSPIMSYTAHCEPGAITASGSATPIEINGLTDNRIYHCALQAANIVGPGPVSPALTVIPGELGNSTDLMISKTNATQFVGGNLRIAYQINVANPGPAAVVGARVTDVLEDYFSDAHWQCSGSNGGQCVASGSGNIDTLVDLPVGSSVSFQLSARLAALPEDPVFNLAAVSVPASITELDSSNNVASDGPDVRGVFQNGFE